MPFLRGQTLEWCWENRRGERGAIAWIHSKLGRLKSHELPEDGDLTPPDTRWHFTGPQQNVMTCRVTSLRRDAECQPQRWFRRWLHYDWKHEGGLLWAAGASESAEAAARQEWSHFIRQQPVGLPGWFMAAILCQNLTTNQVCHEKEADTRSVSRPSTQEFLRCVSEIRRTRPSSNAASRWMLFTSAGLTSCCFPRSPLIIQSWKTGGGHVRCIYLGVCYLSTLQYNCRTAGRQCRHLKTRFIRFLSSERKRNESLCSWVTMLLLCSDQTSGWIISIGSFPPVPHLFLSLCKFF